MATSHWTATAAGYVRDSLPVESNIRKAFPLELIIAAIFGLFDKLIACRKEPDDIVEYLNFKPRRRPFLDWWQRTSPEERLAERRAEMRYHIKRSLRNVSSPDEVADAMFAAIDRGEVTGTLVEGVYEEASSR